MIVSLRWNNRVAQEAILQSIDVLEPGLFIWIGNLSFQLGGCHRDRYRRYKRWRLDNLGVAIVLPGYKLWTTYKGLLE